MDGYLLDTCMLNYWFDSSCVEHGAVDARIATLPAGAFVAISAVTWGEIEYGHRAVSNETAPIQRKYIHFVRSCGPVTLSITHGTAIVYGDLRARLFEKYSPKRLRSKKCRLRQLRDPISETELGIQENDLWIAAQAVERRLVLVTHDSMVRISSLDGIALRIEDWAKG